MFKNIFDTLLADRIKQIKNIINKFDNNELSCFGCIDEINIIINPNKLTEKDIQEILEKIKKQNENLE